MDKVESSPIINKSSISIKKGKTTQTSFTSPNSHNTDVMHKEMDSSQISTCLSDQSPVKLMAKTSKKEHKKSKTQMNSSQISTCLSDQSPSKTQMDKIKNKTSSKSESIFSSIQSKNSFTDKSKLSSISLSSILKKVQRSKHGFELVQVFDKKS
ncbi:hypothetical protein BpHYR1_003413 [Brachionus plicatilis]|uniref:Uncharacterized protein n=1 Tax=Brachionus plicatilis TaxID=10195 RepID=A0A3M7RCW4_BRAPC|nr:hypothetical protein BpHYR1_003413 [Brachionus plicatilis]